MHPIWGEGGLWSFLGKITQEQFGFVPGLEDLHGKFHRPGTRFGVFVRCHHGGNLFKGTGSTSDPHVDLPSTIHQKHVVFGEIGLVQTGTNLGGLLNRSALGDFLEIFGTISVYTKQQRGEFFHAVVVVLKWLDFPVLAEVGPKVSVLFVSLSLVQGDHGSQGTHVLGPAIRIRLFQWSCLNRCGCCRGCLFFAKCSRTVDGVVRYEIKRTHTTTHAHPIASKNIAI